MLVWLYTQSDNFLQKQPEFSFYLGGVREGIVLRTNLWLVLRLTWKTSFFSVQDFSVPVLLLPLQNLPLYKSHWRQWSFATCICLIRFPILKAISEDIFNYILCGTQLMMGKVEQGIVLDCVSDSCTSCPCVVCQKDFAGIPHVLSVSCICPSLSQFPSLQ